MQKSGFPKLCHYAGFLQIRSQTVNGERFPGVNFHRFHPMKFFMGKLLWCLTLNNAIIQACIKCFIAILGSIDLISSGQGIFSPTL